MLVKPFSIALLCLFGVSMTYGQNSSKIIKDPSFDKFKGTVYSMPLIIQDHGTYRTKSIQEKYAENIYDYREIATMEMDQINVNETTIGYGTFPGVEKKTQFCMILKSKMEIHEDACYEFSLNSDDGSILWINGEEIINDDGGHQMTMVKDSIILKKGFYNIKLWYFQGLPDRFGFKMNAKVIGGIEGCDTFKEELELQSSVLFKTGAFTLTDKALDELNKFVQTFISKEVKSIEIIGHTDNVGHTEDNLQLSKNRADAIVIELRKQLKEKPIEISAIGKGESQPKASNESASGREMNRRVQLIIR